MQLNLKLTSFLIFFTLFSNAQNGIKGFICDKEGQPLSQVSISFLNSLKQLEKESHSSESGRFSQVMTPGRYHLIISHQGYETLYLDDVLVEQGFVDLDTLYLFSASQKIEAITLKANPRLIEQRADRMVMNIENSVLSDGMTALEILERAPGVKVSDDGEIQMRGKKDVAVMINGKLSYLSQKELTSLLRGTSSSSVKSIELITNPSAKFDAQGMGGLINIVLKNQRKKGFNATLNAFAGAGRKLRNGSGINLNVQREKWNLYSAYDYAFRGEEEYRQFDRFFEKLPTELQARVSKQYSVTEEPLNTHNAKFGLDYMPSSSQLISLNWSGNFGTYKNLNQGYNNILFDNGELISNSMTDNSNISTWNNHNMSLGYVHRLGEKGHELTADLDFLHAAYDADQLLISDFQRTKFQQAFISKRKNQTPSITKLAVAKIDYHHQLKENQNVEIGWKSSVMEADNNAINDTLKGAAWIRDLGTSNHFLYKEQIHAGYLNYQWKKAGWSLQAGLRAEKTLADGLLLTTVVQHKRSYLNWFPSATLARQWDVQHQTQLSYSRRINRPDYDDLNPFRYYVDAFVFYEGNPLLQPEKAHAFELNYGYGRYLNISFFYTEVAEVMTSVLTQIPEKNMTIRSVANIEGFRNVGTNINHSYQPWSYWTSINNVLIYQNHYFGAFNKEVIDNKGWSLNYQSNNSFKLPKAWQLEVNGQYLSPESDGVYRRKAMGSVSVGVQKKLMKENLTLKLSGNDVFKTMRYRTASEVGAVRMNQHFNLDSRTFILSATFKIGKDFTKERRSDPETDEMKRVRGGS